MQNELKPCPFCGGGADIGQGTNYFFVNCIDCMASTNTLLGEQHRSTREEAIEAWNTRAKAPATGQPVQYGYDPGTPDGDVPALTFRRGEETTAILTGKDAREVAAFIKDLAESSPEREAAQPVGLPINRALLVAAIYRDIEAECSGNCARAANSVMHTISPFLAAREREAAQPDEWRAAFQRWWKERDFPYATGSEEAIAREAWQASWEVVCRK